MKNCIACGKEPLTKDEIGINKKLLGEQVDSFYCIDCLADYLEVDTQDLLDKIELIKSRNSKRKAVSFFYDLRR